MAASLVVAQRARVMRSRGREFFKLSGSGNDFVFFDTRSTPAGELEQPAVVAAICARATGVGADGVVFLESSTAAEYRLRYLNRDGSPAALCGNAVLCSARLAVQLGIVSARAFDVETDAGVVRASAAGARPEIALPGAREVRPDADRIEPAPGERRVGHAVVGVPHLVVLCDDVGGIDVDGRGRRLRRHPSLPAGANVNFVAPHRGDWKIRTYERGVEAETLACGTGAAASAVLLAAWGEAAGRVCFHTRSGSTLEVVAGPARADAGTAGPVTLCGPARIVFRGELGELDFATDAGGHPQPSR